MTAEVLRHLRWIAASTTELLGMIKQEDWATLLAEDKRTIGELAGHIAVLPEADLLLSDEATADDMTLFYASKSLADAQACTLELERGIKLVCERYGSYDEDELHQVTTAYWGVTYSRYEWLLEILTHLTHHRAQLHAILVYRLNYKMNLSLFE